MFTFRCGSWHVALALAAAIEVGAAAEPANYTNSLSMQFVEVPAGEFMMGLGTSPEQAALRFPDNKPSAFKSELPRHQVRITTPFYLGKYEVTIGQLRQFCRESGYALDSERDG